MQLFHLVRAQARALVLAEAHELLARIRFREVVVGEHALAHPLVHGGAANGATGKKRIRRSEIGKYVNEVAAGEVEVVEG